MTKNKENKEQIEEQVVDKENKEATTEEQKEIVDTEKKQEDNLIDIEEKQEKVAFTNPDYKPEEKEKVPDYFVEPPKPQKQAEFGVKNGRTYKKIDEYHGLYTDTGEVFRLK